MSLKAKVDCDSSYSLPKHLDMVCRSKCPGETDDPEMKKLKIAIGRVRVPEYFYNRVNYPGRGRDWATTRCLLL
jgi:hypothetical protein